MPLTRIRCPDPVSSEEVPAISDKPKRRKPSSMSPTKRARAELERLGWKSQIVERWNPFARVRQDLFGCIDIVAADPSVGILGVQACAGSSHATREAKIEAEPRAVVWIESGGRIEVWSFSKRGARGKRKLWTIRRTRAFLVDGRIGWTEVSA